jgi:hypothetical protein
MGVTHMDISKTLIELIQTHLENAQTTQRLIDLERAQYGKHVDVGDIIDGNGWPYDNELNAGIYAWLLHDHLANGIQHWTYEHLSNNTDVGTSGYDAWEYVVEHLIHLGLLSPRT